MIFKDIKLNEYLKNYYLTLFEKKDLPKYIKLFKDIFNKEWDEEYWNWFFYKNPHETITVLLWDNEKLIGGNCGQKKDIIVNGQKLNGIIITNTMVHSNYRRQGIFAYLSQNLYNKLSELGFHLLYGFPNEYYDCKLYKKKNISWDFCAKKMMLIKDIRKKNHLKKNNNMSSKYTISKIEKFPEIINNIKSNENTDIFLEKTSEYLNWRYVEHPLKKYEKFLIHDNHKNLLGYFVLKTFINNKQEKFGEIDDFRIFNNNLQVFEGIYQFIVRYFLEKNNDYLSTWLGVYSNYYQFLLKNQFIEEEMKTSWGYKILQDLSPQIKKKIINPNNWDLRMGDSDVF